MFSNGGYRPSVIILVGGTVVLVLTRAVWGMERAEGLPALVVMTAMGYQVFVSRESVKTAALDFNFNLGGLLYLGWLGSYMISLRNLPDGQWWLVTVFPTIWLCDGGAFLVEAAWAGTRWRLLSARRRAGKATWVGLCLAF